MNIRNNDEVYTDWMIKWRLWKNAWLDCDEQMVEFFIKFISKGREYTPNDHGDLAGSISDCINTCKIDKEGVIEICNYYTVKPTISIIFEDNTKKYYTDRFGVVSLKLSFFTRRDILKVALILETLGHGVLHDDGRIVSCRYANDSKSPRKMPARDDPVWLIIKDSIPRQTNLND